MTAADSVGRSEVPPPTDRPFPDLTREQRLAATAAERTIFIEAGPGTGKTTVSAHRFGVHRFHPARRGDYRAVLAVSFTRAATWSLWRRVRSTWGPAAAYWPHRIVTLDTIMCDLLHDLLRCKLLHWPGGHTELDVRDSWAPFCSPEWKRSTYALRVTKTGRVSFQRRFTQERAAHYPPAIIKKHIDSGICTHADVRDVLEQVLGHEKCATRVGVRIATTMRSLIVDEVFDANDLDIAVIEYAIRAGVAVTMVGDPWQALYVFRGARPAAVMDLLDRNSVPTLPLTRSFRWQSDAQRDLAERLRAGMPVVLPEQGKAPSTRNIDVALSREWKPLWKAGDHVLPLAFGSFKGGYEEAAATLLLNQLTRSTLNEDATYLRDALTALAIDDPGAPRQLASQLQEVIGLLKKPGRPTLNAAYEQLDRVIRAVSPRRLRPAHKAHTDRLADLAKRVLCEGQLIPGLTTHQAKGREWQAVGVYLSDSDREALFAGLRVEMDFHRQLYVACTRACRFTVAIGNSAP